MTENAPSADRAKMLAAIRRHQLPTHDAPDLAGPWIRYASRLEQFRNSLESVGGQLRHVPELTDVLRELTNVEAYQVAQRRICCVPNLLAGDDFTSLEQVDDAHNLADVDFAVIEGELGVAENGAIFVTDRNVRHRVIFFITQHLAIVVRASQLVDTMHDAYEQIDFTDNAFRCFISGPSKTADIEQSLVIGAHGARSLTVITYGAP
ncbi:MAG: LUD domain-containing protein [Planctomycetales bacterium]|nr:LUD domain-containing protein [Planctomycetales bacterium]